MWANYIPDDPLLRALPFGFVAAICLWGLISPRTQGPILWRWQRQYRQLDKNPAARDELIRRQSTLPFIVSIVVGLMLLLKG